MSQELLEVGEVVVIVVVAGYASLSPSILSPDED
jgi:hypothetical protein